MKQSGRHDIWHAATLCACSGTHLRITTMQTILRLPSVEAETGLSCATIYRRVAEGLWPKPVSLGARAVGWPAREVYAINAARIAGQCDQEIRALVLGLHQERGRIA
ncbi:MAG TPA: AlpA family phage regulatory protein [Steroidobacteraceae bacterium]|nr:AlpA family phage regulatory protein [Steroidobacteraceae bacterium]